MTLTPTRRTSSVEGGASTHDDLDISNLARQIAHDGTSCHHHALGRVADITNDAALLPGAVDVLRDTHAPEAARARAFLAIVRQWDEILTAAAQRVAFEQSFTELAAHWAAHQELRSHGDIEALARSGSRLDELRSCARQHALSSC